MKDVLPHYIATTNESMTTAVANIKAQDTVPENTESDVLEDDAVLAYMIVMYHWMAVGIEGGMRHSMALFLALNKNTTK